MLTRIVQVHRTVLMRDESTFGDLLSLPTFDNSFEGLCDEQPIVLQGDTAEEFRCLLWGLYALYICQHHLLFLY